MSSRKSGKGATLDFDDLTLHLSCLGAIVDCAAAASDPNDSSHVPCDKSVPLALHWVRREIDGIADMLEKWHYEKL